MSNDIVVQPPFFRRPGTQLALRYDRDERENKITPPEAD